MADLTPERLRELLRYECTTGIFYWRVSRGTRRSGDKAGCLNTNGYVQIMIDGVNYYGHRLAWMYLNGSWPPETIDHRYGDKANNSEIYIRAATRTENNQNTVIRSDNSTGHKGVSFDKNSGKYQAKIRINGKQKHLGRYMTAEEASEVYQKAAEHYFGDFVRHDKPK